MFNAEIPNASGDTWRSVYLICRRCGDVVHPIHWSSRELRIVARSSMTAEILAATEVTSIGLYVSEVSGEFLSASGIELATILRSLMALETSVHEPEDRLTRIDLTAIR